MKHFYLSIAVLVVLSVFLIACNGDEGSTSCPEGMQECPINDEGDTVCVPDHLGC